MLFRKNQNKVILNQRLKEEQHQNTILKKELEAQSRLIEEKERISLDLHDDMGSTLSAIGLQATLLKDKTNSTIIEEGLSQIIGYSEELNLSMREIMWSLSSKNDNIEDFINYIKNYINSYFESTKIKCVFNIEEQVSHIALNNFIRRQLYLVIKEICHNIYKHSSATEVVFKSHILNKVLMISILDNGNGINDISNIAGNGIQSIKNRVAKLEGEVFFKNLTPNGLRLEIRIPI